MKLDFSEFHPLDHHILSSRCTRLPGGGRRHIGLWWTYQCPDPIWWLRKQTLCRFGWHGDYFPWWDSLAVDLIPETASGWSCEICGEPPPNEVTDEES